MGPLVIAGGAALGAIFMTMFFVELCMDGGKLKLCEVLKLDTETESTEIPAPVSG
jgi:hypothetical protein